MKKITNYEKFSNLLDNYLLKITEAFNTSSEIKWVDKDNTLIGLFIVNEEVYQIFCKDYGNNIWSFKFQHYNKTSNTFSHDLTNLDNSKFTILGTIIKGFEYLIRTKEPNALVYGAGDESKGRKNIYSMFCNDISKRYDYKKITKVQSNKQIFVNFKKELDPEDLLKTIKTIVDDSFGIN